MDCTGLVLIFFQNMSNFQNMYYVYFQENHPKLLYKRNVTREICNLCAYSTLVSMSFISSYLLVYLLTYSPTYFQLSSLQAIACFVSSQGSIYIWHGHC